MGQCMSSPLVQEGATGETEEEYRKKWNDIRRNEVQQQQQIKANHYTTTADVGIKRHGDSKNAQYGAGRTGYTANPNYQVHNDSGLMPIDEHQSLRLSSPQKQTQIHPASPMRNGFASYQKPVQQVSYQGAHEVRRDERSTISQVPEHWTCGDLIGQGAFGSVYLGMDNDTGHLMAVKQVSLGHVGTASSSKITEHVRSVEAEVGLLQQLDHPNIVRYLGTERTPKALNIFLEYVPGGSIASLLSKFGPFKESLVKVYSKQILLGLEYLHKNGIMHRDIKGANILVDNTGLVKLADFGASKKIEDLVTIGSGANSVKGTPYWMAPEVITQSGHGRQADIWSVACTVIEMATGKPPWSQYGSQVAAMFHIAKSKGPPMIPEHLSPDCKDFLYLCFNRNWKERPQASTLLQHPFLADVPCRNVPEPVIQQVERVVPRQLPANLRGVGVTQPLQASHKVVDVSMDEVSAPYLEGTATSPDPSEKTYQEVTRSSRPGPRRQLNLDVVGEPHGTRAADKNEELQTKMREEKKTTQFNSKRPAVRASAPVFPVMAGNSSASIEELQRRASAKPPLPATKQSDSIFSSKNSQSVSKSNEETQSMRKGLKEDSSSGALTVSQHSSSGTHSSKRSSAGISAVSGGSFENFNPMEEPEGVQQQARMAMKSLQEKLGGPEQEVATSRGLTSSSSLGERNARASVRNSRESTRSKHTNVSSYVSHNNHEGRSGISEGPIVYTIAADSSNNSSVPGLPWDSLQNSWSTASRHSGDAQSLKSSHKSTGTFSRTTSMTRSSLDPSSLSSSQGRVSSLQEAPAQMAPPTSSFRRTTSTSSSLSHESTSGDGAGRSSCGEGRSSCGDEPTTSDCLPRSSSLRSREDSMGRQAAEERSRELATPRKHRSTMTGSSTPAFSPSRIPRPPGASPARHLDPRSSSGLVSLTPRRSLPSTPMRNTSPMKRAGGETMGTYEQQHARQMELKRSTRATPSRKYSTPRKAMSSSYQVPSSARREGVSSSRPTGVLSRSTAAPSSYL